MARLTREELQLAHSVRPISKAWALILETVKDFLEIYCKKSVLRQREGSETLSIMPYVTQGKNIIPLNWG